MLASLKDFYTFEPAWILKNIPESPFGKRRMKKLEIIFKRKLSKYLGKRIIDLCCGTGIVSFVLSRLGYEVVGVDLLDEMLKIAQKYNEKFKLNVRFILADVRELELNEKFETGIFFGNSIIHFSPKDLEKVCKRVFDLGCKFLIFEYEDGTEILKEKYRFEECDDKFYIFMLERYEDGKAKISFIDLRSSGKYSIEIFIWTPVFLEYVLENSGFRLVERFKEDKIYDVYERI